MLSILFFILTAAAAENPLAFKPSPVRKSYPLDCHFRNDEFKGRFRMDQEGAAKLALALIATPAKVYECEAVVENIEQNTVKLRPTTSLHLVRRMTCEPDLPSELFNRINLNPELVLTWQVIDFEIRDRDAANRCHILSYDRGEVGRILKKMAGPGRKLEWPTIEPGANR